MIRVSRTSELSTGPDLTALIDIVFIVVVFLLLTANTSLLSLPVEVPKTDHAIDTLSSEQLQILISIKPSTPHWSLRIESANNKVTTTDNEEHHESWKSFRSSLLSHTNKSNAHLLIATDKETNASLLLQLLAFLNEHKISNTQILMEAQR